MGQEFKAVLTTAEEDRQRNGTDLSSLLTGNVIGWEDAEDISTTGATAYYRGYRAQWSYLLLTASITISRSGEHAFGEHFLLIEQDGIGGWVATFNAAHFVAPGGSIPAVTTAAGAKDLYKITCIPGPLYIVTRVAANIQ